MSNICTPAAVCGVLAPLLMLTSGLTKPLPKVSWWGKQGGAGTAHNTAHSSDGKNLTMAPSRKQCTKSYDERSTENKECVVAAEP